MKRIMKKAPSTNIQAPEKFQAPNLKRGAGDFLEFEVCSFYGGWCFEFGALISP
jgi:hypothetical protein